MPPECYGDIAQGSGFFYVSRETDFYEAICGGLGRTPAQERAMRLAAWRVHNDLLRDDRLLQGDTAAEAEDQPAGPQPLSSVDDFGDPPCGPTPPPDWWAREHDSAADAARA